MRDYFGFIFLKLVALIGAIFGIRYGVPVFYHSFKIFYNQIFIWMKYSKSIDISTYTCITSNSSKHCESLASSPPFTIISPEFIKWLTAPSDWFGLHAIIKPLFGVPFWLVGFLLSYIILGAVVGFIYILFQLTLDDFSNYKDM